ncbi:MAG: S4 domain-containing protein, partial [Cohaesibacter sp.]|nr:S4 domain-containing protein [Cohaesibacter sp.]
KQTFEQGQAGGDLPTVDVDQAKLDAGYMFIDAMVDLGFAKSKGEARRLVKGGGARLNDAQIKDTEQALTAADIVDGQAKISAGKKRHGLVKLA